MLISVRRGFAACGYNLDPGRNGIACPWAVEGATRKELARALRAHVEAAHPSLRVRSRKPGPLQPPR